MTINCKEGDSVKIRVSGGRAWLTGNLTSPPTDDTAANEANKTVTKVKNPMRILNMLLRKILIVRKARY